jgi:predicted MFS family arabinose efflux permease
MQQHPSERLPLRAVITVFGVFALAYFVSTLLRAITATLAPVLSAELSLQASDLGLLAGGYFLGFAVTQLPLGHWLDQHGPRRVILLFLGLAVLGCLAFAWADSFAGLMAARVLIGAGVSACLMAPLTGYRRWLDAGMQLRANAWMLMTGSFGMLAATLPVQWLMPVLGWRGIFVALAALLLLSMALIARYAPGWPAAPAHAAPAAGSGQGGSYADVWRHPYFRKMLWVGFFVYGGMVAIQTLWAGPWLVRVVGLSPTAAATGLFAINLSMLLTFWAWGWLMPALSRRGWQVETLMAWGLPLHLAVLALNIALGEQASWAHWALFCVTATVGSLAQPAVAQAFPPAMAGRALSAYNLVIFAGIFVVQWGLGLLIDAFQALGWAEVAAFRGAMAVYLAVGLASYAAFLSVQAHNRTP